MIDEHILDLTPYTMYEEEDGSKSTFELHVTDPVVRPAFDGKMNAQVSIVMCETYTLHEGADERFGMTTIVEIDTANHKDNKQACRQIAYYVEKVTVALINQGAINGVDCAEHADNIVKEVVRKLNYFLERYDEVVCDVTREFRGTFKTND